MISGASKADGPSWTKLVLSGAVVTIVLAPYVTLRLEFRWSLYVQAGLITLVVVLLLLFGAWRRPPDHGLAPRARPLRVGFWLYLGAAALGLGVGLVRGNSAELVGGQLLSMLLLPAGIVAGNIAVVRDRRTVLGWTLVAAASIACLIQFAVWIHEAAQGMPQVRLILANGVSAAGPVFIALPLAFGLGTGGRGHRWLLSAWLMASIIGLYVIGSGTRSLWLAVAAALGVWLLLSGEARRFLDRRLILGALAVILVAAALLLSGKQWLARTGEPVLTVNPDPRAHNQPEPIGFAPWPEPPSGPGGITGEDGWSASAPAVPGAWYRIHFCPAETGSNQPGWLVSWISGERKVVFGRQLRTAGDGGACSTCYVAAPPGTSWLGVRHEDGLPPQDRLSVERVGPAPVVVAVQQWNILADRVASLVAIARGIEKPGPDGETVRFRLEESRKLIHLVREAPVGAKLLGHGLGATFPLDMYGWDNRGRWIRYADVNYIHNFYAFLLYKLGLVGGGMVVTALLLWTSWAVWRVVTAGSQIDRPLLAAAAAVLVAALAWSLSSPVFLNFRLAPLWGLLVATFDRPRLVRLRWPLVMVEHRGDRGRPGE